MAKKSQPEPITEYRDETANIPRGEVRYWLLLDDDEVEALASGRCPKRTIEAAWKMLEWKRSANQEWASYPEQKVG